METNSSVFNPKTLKHVGQVEASDAMTTAGAINKAGILFLLLVATSACSWHWTMLHHSFLFFVPALVFNFILGLIVVFMPSSAPVLAPVYALVEGVMIGSLSASFETRYPGVVLNAILLTLGSLGAMIAVYKWNLIQVTEKFQLAITSITAAVVIAYALSLGTRWLGYSSPLMAGGWVGIGFSLFAVIVATLNLLLDFDMMEYAAKSQAPKYMEWYAGFSLLVTILWIYLEFLRLLAILNEDD